MTSIRTKALLLGAAALIAPAAGAQSITKLLLEGDDTPFNGGTLKVREIHNVDINDNGKWLVEFVTITFGSDYDRGVMYDGTLIHEEGTWLGLPAPYVPNWIFGDAVDCLDINDNNDRLVMLNIVDVAGVLANRDLVLWTSGATGITFPLLEQRVTPCTVAGEPAGAVWAAIHQVWQNSNNEIIVAGRSDTDLDEMLVHMTHDGAGTILTQTLFAAEGVNHAVAFPPSDGVHATNVQSLTHGKANLAFSDAGQKMFFIDDDHTVAGGHTSTDSHYYIDTTEVLWEPDDAPSAGNFTYNHLSIGHVDINDSGSWVATVRDTNPTQTVDTLLIKDGALFQQEGSSTPSDVGTGSFIGGNWGPVQISDFGEVTWFGRWGAADFTTDTGVFRDDKLLIREGVTMIDGSLVLEVSSSSNGMAASDNGRYIIVKLIMQGLGGREGAFRVEMDTISTYCHGDGTGNICPCGNFGATGEGCLNSTGLGGVLGTSGTASLAADNLVLQGSQLPANRPGLFFAGTNQTNGGMGNLFGDGLLCVGGPIVRLEVLLSDAGGSCSTTVPVASTIGATLGQDSYFQLWFRDPSGICGAGFGTTNALGLTWN